MPTTLLTVHHEPLPAIANLALRLTGRIRLKSATTSALVYRLAARLAGENFFAFSLCRQKYDALAKQMIEDSGRVTPEDIFTRNRLKVLTILSAIFMPLTLIAGIYGMNFENMPELHAHYAYYAVLGFMALLGIGMLGFFHKKGWFD